MLRFLRKLRVYRQIIKEFNRQIESLTDEDCYFPITVELKVIVHDDEPIVYWTTPETWADSMSEEWM